MAAAEATGGIASPRIGPAVLDALAVISRARRFLAQTSTLASTHSPAAATSMRGVRGFGYYFGGKRCCGVSLP
jgi:hypothetical protein